MNTTVHQIDRYNFNNGVKDVASRAPDNENGRLEQFGWANLFNTVGELHKTLEWKQDEVSNLNTSSEDSSRGSGRRGGRRERRDERR